MPPFRKKPPQDLMDSDLSFEMNRLYDNYNFDHVPKEDRMKLFKHRDLSHIKNYKAAVKIFGGPLSRKRIINAPPMETPMKHRLGLYEDRTIPPAESAINAPLARHALKARDITEEDHDEKAAEAKESEYKQWVKERQKFRNDISNMGLNEKWLAGKGEKSALEQRLFNKMTRKASLTLEEPVVVEEKEVKVITPVIPPKINVPSPVALKIIYEHLKVNRMRLLDLFTQVDKNKNWFISREEFRSLIKQYKFPITDMLLEDLIMALDADMNDQLDYREIAKGMRDLKKEKYENRRKELFRDPTCSTVYSNEDEKENKSVSSEYSSNDKRNRHRMGKNARNANNESLSKTNSFEKITWSDKKRTTSPEKIGLASQMRNSGSKEDILGRSREKTSDSESIKSGHTGGSAKGDRKAPKKKKVPTATLR